MNFAMMLHSFTFISPRRFSRVFSRIFDGADENGVCASAVPETAAFGSDFFLQLGSLKQEGREHSVNLS
mgnify:FL=1|jgi:hypothetical protein